MAGKVTFDEQVTAGKAKLVGDRKPLDQLRGMLVQFTPDFELVPGTKLPTPATQESKDPFQQTEPGDTSGG